MDWNEKEKYELEDEMLEEDLEEGLEDDLEDDFGEDYEEDFGETGEEDDEEDPEAEYYILEDPEEDALEDEEEEELLDTVYSVNAITQYLRSMPKKQLTSEEEVALAERIARGDEDAKTELVEANLRLAVYKAKFYQHRGVSLEDLIQCANNGLMMAAAAYNPYHPIPLLEVTEEYRAETKPYRFSTYADKKLKKELQKVCDEENQGVKIPSDVVGIRNRLKKLEREMTVSLSRAVSYEEVCQELVNITLENMKRKAEEENQPQPTEKQLNTKKGYLERRFKRILPYWDKLDSIDRNAHNNGDKDSKVTVGDKIKDENQGEEEIDFGFADALMSASSELVKCLMALPKEESDVIRLSVQHGHLSKEKRMLAIREGMGNIKPAKVKKLLESAKKRLTEDPEYAIPAIQKYIGKK